MKSIQLSPEEEQLIHEYRAEKAKKAWKPKAKEDYTVEEKIAFFDESYDNALKILHEKEQDGHYDEDEPQWCFEFMMGLLGPGIWSYFNSLDKD